MAGAAPSHSTTPQRPVAPPQTVTPPEAEGVGLRDRLLMALTFSSGAIDAICFLALGKVFTAFMTGNFVFFGLRVAGAPGPYLSSVVIAIGVFSAGVFLSSRIVNPTRGTGVWPRRVTAALAVSVLAHACFVIVWLIVSGRPSLGSANLLLGVSALAMGVQTGAVFSLGVTGVFTTAATATTTVLMGDVAHWATTAADRRRMAGILLALATGAIAGGLLVVHARSWAPVLPLVVTATTLTAANVGFGTRETTPRRSTGLREVPPVTDAAG
jgi:uncharacterized membrane protein YoaK (UPF0700 family)